MDTLLPSIKLTTILASVLPEALGMLGCVGVGGGGNYDCPHCIAKDSKTPKE